MCWGWNRTFPDIAATQAEKEKLAATGDSSCKSSDNKGSRAQSRSPGLTNLSKDDTESQDAASHHKNDCQGPCSITEASTDMGGKSEDISERAKQRAPQSRSKGSRKQHQPAPAAEESDDEEERQVGILSLVLQAFPLQNSKPSR